MRGRTAEVMALGVVATLAGTTSPALADPPGPNALPVHVVTIKTEESDPQADALTTAVKAEVRNLAGWSLAEGDYSLELLALALRCPSPPDRACELRIANEIGTDRFIWGTINVKGGRSVGVLNLWQREQGQTSVNLSYSANLTEPNDGTLRKIVADAVATLTGGPPKGSVQIQAGDVHGQIFVDGAPSGVISDGRATIFVPAGNHGVEVRAPGYANISGSVSVRPSSSMSLVLVPTPLEGSRAIGGGSNLRRIGAYGALAAGGALLAGGVYSSLKVNSINHDDSFVAYRASLKNQDICDAADQGVPSPSKGAASPAEVQDKCATAAKFQSIQYVFYVLSAISVGTGAYLLATEKGPSEEGNAAPSSPRVRVVPSAGYMGGGMDVRLIF